MDKLNLKSVKTRVKEPASTMVTKNTKKSPVTNWIGGILVIGPMVIWVAAYFMELKKEPNELVLASICALGLALWFGFSDDIFKAAFTWVKNKLGIK